MSCKVIKEENAVRVLIRGAFKRDLSLELSEALEKLIARRSPTVILDLAEIDFLDSSSLGLIIFSSKRIQAYGGQLCLKNPSSSVAELLADSRLNRVVKILGEN
jgi:anti-sigma B factor antagonist